MNRSRYIAFALICIVGLALGAALPFPVFAAAEILGQHIVQKGETLYCIGRGYGVVPSAIAEANGLSAFALLSIGQVLKIPAVQWSPIPPGPVCAPQFPPPFGSVPTATPTPPTATPTATATSSQGVCGQTYTVRRGDNLFRIGLRYGVTVVALKAANSLTGNTIYPGQVLVIPCVTSTPTPIGTQPPNVQITSIRFNGAVFQVESDEYAVITNVGGTAVNLAGWRLNAGDAGQNFTFPSFDLQPGQSCRVYTNEVHTETCGFSFGRGSAIWNNAGDCGYLYDARGALVATYCY